METHPSVDRVLTLTTIEHIDATDDGFAVSLLVDPDDLAARTPAEWKARVLDDQLAPGVIVSKDGKAVALVVRPIVLKESLARRDILIALDAAIRAEKLDAYQTATAGTVAQTVEELRSLWRDSAIFIPLTVVIGLVLLWWVVGRVRPMIIGGRVNISTLFLFFGILGGLQAYGPVGVFVGPVLLATIVVVLRIYREEYAPSTG